MGAIEGYFPSPGTGNVFGVGCPFFPAARAEAAAQQYPVCNPAPSGEAVTLVRPAVARFRDPPGVAGDGFQSGGPYPAEGAAFFTTYTGAAGEVTCTLPATQQPLCRAIVDDFIARSAPL